MTSPLAVWPSNWSWPNCSLTKARNRRISRSSNARTLPGQLSGAEQTGEKPSDRRDRLRAFLAGAAGPPPPGQRVPTQRAGQRKTASPAQRPAPSGGAATKLFVGVSDPTNYQAINDIQFSTGLNTEAILVEDDKLSDAIEKFFDSHNSGLEDMADADLDGVDIESIDDRNQGRHRRARRRRRAGGALCPQDVARRNQERLIRPALRTLRENLPRADAHRRHVA